MAEITYGRLLERQLKSDANQWWRMRFYPLLIRFIVVVLTLVVFGITVTVLSLLGVFLPKSADTVNNIPVNENVVVLTDFPDKLDWYTRRELAVAAYKSGKATKIYVIGDSTRSADLVLAGVPAIDIVVIPEEYRLSNACRRLRREFFVTKLIWAADKVDQFTLAFLCTREGVDSFVLTSERLQITGLTSHFGVVLRAISAAYNN